MLSLSRLSALLFVAGVLLTAFARAELPAGFDMDGPLPVDPDVRVGELENGLRYYVRENARPEGRASLKLVINAGSLQEADTQRGIAHFLEHMAFNGTTHFAKQELIHFLEGIGMNFGQHLNASTSFDQTIYELEVPWDDPEIVDKSLLILEDWASGLTLDPREIEQERGVIVEEWRSGQGARQRVSDQQYPLIYFNSRYAKRLPIGSMIVVRRAPADRFVDFYTKWYRPNLMSVIAVGDFDGEVVEQQIIERFSKLQNPEDAPERLTYEVPDHEQTLFSIVTDPELTSTSANVYLKMDADEDSSGEDYRRHLVERLYFTLLNQRLAERTIVANPPYLSAAVERTRLGREKIAYVMSVNLMEGKTAIGLEALSGEVARASRDGFGQGEIDRVIADSIRWIDRAYEEREKTPSGVFASEYTRAFLVDEPIPGISLEKEMTHAFLENLSIEEVNAVGEVFVGDASRVILFSAPEKEGLELPSENDLLAAIETGRSSNMEAYVDTVSDAPLLPEMPTAGDIVSEEFSEALGVYDWRLSNGARVIVKPTDFKNDQILMSAYSEGGHSLVMDDEYVASVTSTMILGESGIGAFNSIELDKKLAGKAVSIAPSINTYSEGLGGSTSTQDIEAFFKLLYLQVTQPNEENLMQAFESVKTRVSAVVANRGKAPQSVFQDAIEETLFGNHRRHRPMNLELLEEMDPELSLAVFKDRFQNAGDFTFVFVGSIEIDSFKEYVKTYVASLPTRNEPPEMARSLGDKPARGRLSTSVSKGLEEKTIVRVLFNDDTEWSPENRYALSFARGLLNIRLREVLREENSGVYGVGVYGSLGRIPEGSYSTGFGFSCDPGNVELLVRLGLMEIVSLQQNGPRPVDVEKVKEQHIRAHEKNLKENGFWLRNLAGLAREGRDLEEVLGFVDSVRAFDPRDAKQAAIDYYNMDNMLIALLKPNYEE